MDYTSDKSADSKFWVDIILHAAETTPFGNMLWLGSMKPDSLNPKYAAIITTPIKLLVLVLVVCVTTATVQETMVKYNMHQSCFKPTGTDVLMLLIPDILFRLEIWQALTATWYMSLLFFTFISTLYSIIGLKDTIVQKFHCLGRHSLVVYFVLCSLGFLLSISLTLNISRTILLAWRHCGLTLLTATLLLLVNLAIFFVYSTRKIIDDYVFTYGVRPEKYWIVSWNAAPIFSIFAFIFALAFQSRNFTNVEANNYLIWASYLQCGLVLMPILAIFVGRCCKNIKNRTLNNLSRPAPTWGPVKYIDKLARRKFFPQRDTKCRSNTLKCKHMCIVKNSSKFMEEILVQERKYSIAKKEMEMEMKMLKMDDENE